MLQLLRNAGYLSALALSTLAASGCVSPPSDSGQARDGARSAAGAVAPAATRTSAADVSRPQMVAFGEPFQTSAGQIFVLRIQDQYRVIRCIPDGPIAGCYEDVLSVSNHDVHWNEWLTVRDVPGLRVAFVSPTAIALFQGPADGSSGDAAAPAGAPTLPPPK